MGSSKKGTTSSKKANTSSEETIEGELVKTNEHWYGNSNFTRKYKLDTKSRVLQQIHQGKIRSFKFVEGSIIRSCSEGGKLTIKLENLMEEVAKLCGSAD